LVPDPLADLSRAACAVHVPQDLLILIVGDERGGHGVVGVESFGNRLLPIVVTMDELGRIGGRIILEMVYLSSPDVGPTQRRALHQELTRQLDVDGRTQGLPAALEQRVERLSLRNGPREAIQNESCGCVRLR